MMSSSMLQSHDPIEQQIAGRVRNLRAAGYLVFQGVEALDVIRKYCAIPGPFKPKLIVHCERELGEPERVLDNYAPRGIVIDGSTGAIEIFGNVASEGLQRKLRFDPNILSDQKGRYISYLSVKPEQKKWTALEAVELLPVT